MELPQKWIEHIGGLEGIDRTAEPLAGAVHAVTRPDGVKNLLSGTRLGHQLHPVLTSLPIGAWSMASAFDYFGGQRFADAACRLVGLGLLSSVPAAGTGAADWSDSYGADRRIGVAHAALNLVATATHASSWAARRTGHRGRGIALSTVGLALTAGAGYVGGHLAYTRGVGVNRTAFESAVTEWTPVAALDDLDDRTPVRVEAATVPSSSSGSMAWFMHCRPRVLMPAGPGDNRIIRHSDVMWEWVWEWCHPGVAPPPAGRRRSPSHAPQPDLRRHHATPFGEEVLVAVGVLTI